MMLCSKPFLRISGKITKKQIVLSGGLEGASPFPCGQCLNCRINQSRVWVHRILLELACHERSCFVTLTYDDDHLPEGGELNREDLRNFIKRLRRRISPFKIRYFGCGEYGGKYYRPHFHICVFGIGSESKTTIENAWSEKGEPIGSIHIGEVNAMSARYITGYILKR